MGGDPAMIRVVNAVLTNELTAVKLNKLRIGETASEQMAADLALETRRPVTLVDSIRQCGQEEDAIGQLENNGYGAMG